MHTSDRPNQSIVRNQPNRIFGRFLSESSAEVRPNRTAKQSLLQELVFDIGSKVLSKKVYRHTTKLKMHYVRFKQELSSYNGELMFTKSINTWFCPYGSTQQQYVVKHPLSNVFPIIKCHPLGNSAQLNLKSLLALENSKCFRIYFLYNN